MELLYDQSIEVLSQFVGAQPQNIGNKFKII